MNKHHCRMWSSGFTLIEMIMVIVITGIISSMVAVFMKQSMDSYFLTVRRAELTDAVDVSLGQLVREVRLAVPNSLRVTDSAGNVGTCVAPNTCFIEFLLSRDGGRYRDAGDGSTGGNILSFSSSASLSFDVLGPMPSVSTGDYIVVYNLGPPYAPADAYQYNGGACGGGFGCNVNRVASVAGSTITLVLNPFATQTPPLPSPDARFQVISGTDGPAVTYACPTTTAGSVIRHWGYGFNVTQPVTFASGSSATLLDRATCAVDYTSNALNRSGLLYVQFTVRDTATTANESATIFQQVHVDNTP